MHHRTSKPSAYLLYLIKLIPTTQPLRNVVSADGGLILNTRCSRFTKNLV